MSSFVFTLTNDKTLHVSEEGGLIKSTRYGIRPEDGATVPQGDFNCADPKDLLEKYSHQMDPAEIVKFRNSFSI